MATLKEHQAAMVDLLANGSGIPASASRLAHAMHDVLSLLTSEQLVEAAGWRCHDATTPGLNDKALSKPQKPLKTDSPSYRPTPAEQRVKELENTCTQLRKQSAQYRATIAGQKEHIEHLQLEMEKLRALSEQAGCRKPDTQVCEHTWILSSDECHLVCVGCEDVKDYK